MSHESAISDLKRLLNQPITANAPEDHIKHLMGESDRATIILHGALLEEMIVSRLSDLMPSINGEERQRLFNYEGPLGSFSNRIRMAQALGIFDRATKKKCEIIKELRNTCAHCHSQVTFQTPEIQGAIAALFGKTAEDFSDWTNQEIRELYSIAVNSLAHVVTADELEMNWATLWSNALDVQRLRRNASRGK